MKKMLVSCIVAFAFATWVESKLKYPKEASQAKEQGQVIVQFTITEGGFVTDVKIYRPSVRFKSA